MSSEKFETALKKLETIVEDLESGQLPLDETLKRYENGIKLASYCSSVLAAAEKKIAVLSKNTDGTFDLTDVELEEEAEDKKGKKKK